MVKQNKTDSEQVADFLKKLDEPVREAIQFLREVVLAQDTAIIDHIKWNAPAFYYTGEMREFDPKEYRRDVLVANLRNGKIMLVFPTGMHLNPQPNLNEENKKDGRRILTFHTPEELRARGSELKALVQDWLGRIEK